MNTSILRYSHVYGPRQYKERVCSIFINNALNGEPLKVYRRGDSTSDFVYVKEIVNANILVAVKDNIAEQTFNIGSGRETSIKDLAQTIKTIIPEANIIHVPDEGELVKRFVFDISRACNLLEYKSSYTLQEGLSEQIQYTRSMQQTK